jgi:hypothetical protein
MLMNTAFVIHTEDNVATLLNECAEQQNVTLLGETSITSITSTECIRAEHKLALRDIANGDSIIKYGMPIGYATTAIKAGDWVHLHNSGSHYDERSNTLDGDSGAPTDTQYV